MKSSAKKTIFCITLFMFGCQSIAVFEPNTGQKHDHLSTLNYAQVVENKNYKFVINQETQYLISDDVDSPAIGVRLPENKSNLNLVIESEFNKTVYAPSVIFLDKSWKQVGEISFQEFHYQKVDLYKGDKMVNQGEIMKHLAL